MRKSIPKPRRKKEPKRVLALPDLEQSKAAVLNSLTSASGQRTYDHAIRDFVAWYCSEPRRRCSGCLCLDNGERDVRLEVEDVVSALGFAAGDHAAPDYDATLGEGDFLA